MMFLRALIGVSCLLPMAAFAQQVQFVPRSELALAVPQESRPLGLVFDNHPLQNTFLPIDQGWRVPSEGTPALVPKAVTLKERFEKEEMGVIRRTCGNGEVGLFVFEFLRDSGIPQEGSIRVKYWVDTESCRIRFTTSEPGWPGEWCANSDRPPTFAHAWLVSRWRPGKRPSQTRR